MAMEIIREKFLGSKAVDVALKTDDGWVAYETQLPGSVRAELLKDMIAKDLRAGFIKVFVSVVTKDDRKKTEAVIAEMAEDSAFSDLVGLKEKVQAKLLADFL